MTKKRSYTPSPQAKAAPNAGKAPGKAAAKAAPQPPPTKAPVRTSGGSARARQATKRRNTVSNFQLQKAERAVRVSWVDRIAHWIGRRSRLMRSVLCALIALVFTAGTAIVLYGSLYNTDPRKINFGPINSATIPYFVLAALTFAGFAFYWAGWRVMIGFDFEDAPLVPGRAAALWLIFGLIMFVFVIIFAGVAVTTAVQP
jgi:hypothetical protein